MSVNRWARVRFTQVRRWRLMLQNPLLYMRQLTNSPPGIGWHWFGAHQQTRQNGLPVQNQKRHVPYCAAKFRSAPVNKQAAMRKGEPILGMNVEVMSQLFRRTRTRAGIIDTTFHDSRHEVITRLTEKLGLARMVSHKGFRQLMT